VNPGLKHGYPDLDGLRQFAREAENRSGDRESFRQLNLNIWLDNSTDPFIDMAVYDKTAEAVAIPEGGDCWIGVDMSSTTDLTAVVACIVDEKDNYHILPFFFVPADNLRARAERDGVPIRNGRMRALLPPQMAMSLIIERLNSVSGIYAPASMCVRLALTLPMLNPSWHPCLMMVFRW